MANTTRGNSLSFSVAQRKTGKVRPARQHHRLDTILWALALTGVAVAIFDLVVWL
jgi:hypothetical protein